MRTAGFSHGNGTSEVLCNKFYKYIFILFSLCQSDELDDGAFGCAASGFCCISVVCAVSRLSYICVVSAMYGLCYVCVGGASFLPSLNQGYTH